MELESILKIISIVLGALCGTLIPGGIALAKAIKAKRNAKTEAEAEQAKNDMLAVVNGFITTAEDLYKGIDEILKAQNQTSGPVKKDSVMTKLQAYAIGRGYAFDAEFWSAKIDEIVDLTRKVNAK